MRRKRPLVPGLRQAGIHTLAKIVFGHGIGSRGHALLFALGAAVILVGTGCNTSRYGVSYDRRLPGVQRVHILPTQVQIQAMHAGGMLERRPDLAADIGPRFIRELQGAVRDKNRAVALANGPEPNATAAESIFQALALARTIENSILTHHYRYGKERVFDYTIGDTVNELPRNGSDAVLLARLVGVVPTGSRIGLAVTAAIVSGLAGSPTHMQTQYAQLTLMLIDAGTGEVLWYNAVAAEANVQNDRALRNLVNHATKYMLEPRKE